MLNQSPKQTAIAPASRPGHDGDRYLVPTPQGCLHFLSHPIPPAGRGGIAIRVSNHPNVVTAQAGVKRLPSPTGKGPKPVWRQPRLTEALLPVNKAPHRDAVHVGILSEQGVMSKRGLENIK